MNLTFTNRARKSRSSHAEKRPLGRIGAAVAAMTAVLPVLAGATSTPTAAAPGVPAAPTPLFTENFENGQTASSFNLITSYTGAAGMRYTADPHWADINLCNGIILAQTAPSVRPSGACGTSDGSWDGVRNIGAALGVVGGNSNSSSNHAVTAYTTVTDPGAGTQLRTVSGIPAAASHFYTFSVDAAAANCFANHPLINLSLLVNNDPAQAIPLTANPIDPCTGPVIAGFPGIQGGTFNADTSVLFSGTSLGIQMTNSQASATGNDGGFDNIRVLDVTPALDKSFSSQVGPGSPARLTFTATNTSELGAKSAWSFTDYLPAGLTVASTPNLATTCQFTTVTAPAGTTSISVLGNLAVGETSCTVSVDVVGSRPGSYTNGAGNLSVVGLNPPASAATLVVGQPARAAVVAGSTNWSLTDGLPGASTINFSYGEKPLVPLMGDWDGDGTKTVGYFRYGTFYLNYQNDSSAPDVTFTFGDPRGYAVAGDFDRNGYDDVAVYRCGTWQFHLLGPTTLHDQTLMFGAPFATDCTWPATVPVAGDWDGDGAAGIGTYQQSTGTWALMNRLGDAPISFVFWNGTTSSYPVVGDWNGDGIDTVGYRVGTIWSYRNTNTPGPPDGSFNFGVTNSVPFTW